MTTAVPPAAQLSLIPTAHTVTCKAARKGTQTKTPSATGYYRGCRTFKATTSTQKRPLIVRKAGECRNSSTTVLTKTLRLPASGVIPRRHFLFLLRVNARDCGSPDVSLEGEGATAYSGGMSAAVYCMESIRATYRDGEPTSRCQPPCKQIGQRHKLVFVLAACCTRPFPLPRTKGHEQLILNNMDGEY